MTQLRLWVAMTTLFAACAPGPSRDPQVGSQTNWLKTCESSSSCGDLECLCGKCTLPCESDLTCTEFPGAVCIPSSDEDALALCEGQLSQGALCLPRCEEPCEDGTTCIAGACTPPPEARVSVTVDPSTRHQTLAGFGASLAYAETAIVSRSDKARLFDVMFAESGFDVLRLTNHYEEANEVALEHAAEIVEAASRRMSGPPMLFMTSGTPPSALKANGSRTCAGNPETCTLVTNRNGDFDYPGFARHWRRSLEAYARVGVVPDYVSIQNHPHWVPGASVPLEACRFLPEEGTETVLVDGVPLEVAYPGYREAFASVQAAIADLPYPPQLGAPEVTAPSLVQDYAQSLDADSFDVLAMHMYGMDPRALDTPTLAEVGRLAADTKRPLFQTEMRADGLTTATLVHHALTTGNVAAYLQNDFVALASSQAPVSLLHLTDTGFEPQDPYYALSHYAKHTDPGWVRLEAISDASELLSSAWAAPDESALTVVLVNPENEDRWTDLELPDALVSRLGRTQVTRTIFAGEERATPLGELSTDQSLRVPGRSIVTVAFTQD